MSMRFCLLLFFFTLFQAESLAQITVTNSSFIYIDSVYLYSNIPINLETTDSHIYLRNKGELLQGETGGFDNTGLGSLSVYQTGNVNEYSFNYWSSPVGKHTTNTSTNNPFSLNLLGDPDSSLGLLDYVAATFTPNFEGSSNPLVISNSWLYSLDATSTGWIYIGSNGELQPGLGFTMKGTSGSDNSQEYEFRGKPNSGTISNVVPANQSILVGNPYPSGLDALLFIHDVDNINAIDGNLLFWEQNISVLSHNIRDYEGGYATYTISADGLLETFIPAPFNTYIPDGSINTTGSGEGLKVASRYLPIGQGFLVTGKVITSGTVRTKNSHRVYSNSTNLTSQFFKISKETKRLQSQYMQLRLNIDFSYPNDTIVAFTRQLVHNFNENATEGFDYGMETKKLNELINDAFWVQNEELYLAKASVFNESLTLPIVIKIKENILLPESTPTPASTLGFRLLEAQNFDTQQIIYLLDKETNISYNLSSETAFLNLEVGNYEDRFEIYFNNTSLSIEDPNLTQTGLTAFFERDTSEINISNKKGVLIDKIVLYNILGVQVLTEQLNTSDTTIKIPTSHLSTGVYLLKCFTDYKTESFKILRTSN